LKGISSLPSPKGFADVSTASSAATSSANATASMNRELSRFELAIVKRTAQNTKSLRTKRDKLVEKIEKAQEE